MYKSYKLRKSNKSIQRVSIVLFIILFLSIILVSLNNNEVKAKEDKEKVIILYESTNIFGFNDNIINHLKELISGAYNKDITLLDVDKYRERELEKYAYAFVVGINKEVKNDKLISDLKGYKGQIIWCGLGVNNLLKSSKNYNLEYEGITKDTIISMHYSQNKRDFVPKLENAIVEDYNGIYTILSPKSDDVEILSYMGDGEKYYPHILRDKNLLAISQIDDSNISLVILADVLNNVFHIKREDKGKIFLRIEDLHPLRDVKILREMAEYLYKENIPYMVALIPVFIDTKTGYLNTISENKELIDTLKYMQEHGGSFILHGYTHQNSIKETSGEGFEFWDGEKDIPLDVDIEKYVYDKVGNGLKECIKNSIYPIAFEAPHYAMDSKGYKEIKKYFSTYSGQYQNSDKKFTSSLFPYVLRETEHFNKLIPENLGYFEPDNPLSLEKIKRNFNIISLAKGYTAGVFYHSYLSLKNLKEIVEFFKEQDVEFIDLKNEDNWVKWEDISIESKNGDIKVNFPKDKYKIKVDSSKEKNKSFISKINVVIMRIVAIFCMIFFILFLQSKKKDQNKFLGR